MRDGAIAGAPDFTEAAFPVKLAGSRGRITGIAANGVRGPCARDGEGRVETDTPDSLALLAGTHTCR